MKKIRIKIRIVLIIISVLILGWVVDRNFVLTKPLEIVYDFSQDNAFISFLKPESRVSEIKEADGEFYQTMTSEPAYFELNLPLSFFKTAEIILDYDNLNQEVVELGLEIGEGNYYLKPLENKVLDNLDWNRICNEEICLWQRGKQHEDINSFLDNLPSLDKVGVYHYDIDEPYLIDNYESQVEYQELNYSLRGSHTFYTYLKDEVADFIFTLEDMNRSKGGDEIKVNLYDENNNLLFSDKMVDDGNPEGNEVVAIPRKLNFQTPELPEGVYRMEVVANDDVFIRQIRTKQQYIVFINKVYLGDTVDSSFSPDKDVELLTNSKQIKAVVPHSEGFQILKIGGEELNLNEAYKQYSYINDKNEISVYIPKGDVLLQSDDLWSFDKHNFFDPRIRRVTTNRDLEGLDFIIAKYQPMGKKQTQFNLYNVIRENGKIKFIISAPGLDVEGNEIDVNKIKIEISRPKINWENFKRFISKIYE